MPIYCYRCELGHTNEDFKRKPNPSKYVKCKVCGQRADRDVGLEHIHTDCGDAERWSDSMGVNPDQIPLAMKTFPGSEYDHEGRLKIKNRCHKKVEMKRRGYVEL